MSNMRGVEGVPWADADVRRLRELAATGMTKRQIAEALGRSMDSVGGKLHKLRVASAPSSTTRTRGPGGVFEPGQPKAERAGRTTLPPLPSLSRDG
jgi:hypothetical protein